MIPRWCVLSCATLYSINLIGSLIAGEGWMAWRAFVIVALCTDRIWRTTE